MSSTFLLRTARLMIILFFQIVVFNHIHLLGYITPLVMGYMLVCFHRNTSRIAILLWGFATGFLFDIFSNTAGMAAASCTLVALMQPVLLQMFCPRDAAEDLVPTFRSLGFWSYLFYVLILMLVLHGAFYLLDAFTLIDWQLTAFSIIGGSLFTTISIVLIEFMVRSRKSTTHFS